MNESLLLFVVPPLLLVPAMGVLSKVRSSHRIGEELKRKAFHVGFGLVALSFPAIWSETWMALTGLLLAVCWLAGVRVLPCLQKRFGSVLHDCDRRSMGEFYYAAAVAGLFLVSRENVLTYVIPLLILALADAAAAIIGRLVPSRKLRGIFAAKSVAGCSAFFAVSLTVCAVTLFACSQLPAWSVVSSALVVAAATTLAEAASKNGLDNLFVPFTAWAVLTTLPV